MAVFIWIQCMKLILQIDVQVIGIQCMKLILQIDVQVIGLVSVTVWIYQIR